MILRPYQRDLFEAVRGAFRRSRRVAMQLATGAGKTAIFSAMARGAHGKGRRVWIVVPRQELLDQASQSLSRLGVPHGRIAAGHAESAAFAVHVVSSSTLIRRWDKIRHKPDFLVVDEAHLHYDRQAEMQERFGDLAFLGVTASPERLDGRGLSDLYDELVEGPPLETLIEQGYLAPLRYYAPPIDGLDQVHRRGTEYDKDELAELLTRRRVYGSALEHYQRHAAGRSALVFTRSVEAAEDVAHRFSSAGYRFEPISGKTPTAQRRALVDGLREGRLHGIVNCEIATYGLDIPRVSALILLRPTTSKALQVQMIGRGLRPTEGKRDCVVLDHVGILQQFGHPLAPYKWRFHGTEKRQARNEDPQILLKLCPYTFMYCTKPSCRGCPYNEGKIKARAEAVVDCELQEAAPPRKLADRPEEERREFQDRLGDAVERAREELDRGGSASGPIGELLSLANRIGRQPMWVYWRLCAGKKAVQPSVLHEIARQKKYKPGWAHFKARDVQKRIEKGKTR